MERPPAACKEGGIARSVKCHCQLSRFFVKTLLMCSCTRLNFKAGEDGIRMSLKEEVIGKPEHCSPPLAFVPLFVQKCTPKCKTLTSESMHTL